MMTMLQLPSPPLLLLLLWSWFRAKFNRDGGYYPTTGLQRPWGRLLVGLTIHDRDHAYTTIRKMTCVCVCFTFLALYLPMPFSSSVPTRCLYRACLGEVWSKAPAQAGRNGLYSETQYPVLLLLWSQALVSIHIRSYAFCRKPSIDG